MQQEIYKYSHGDLPCEGLIVRKPNLILPAPVVVICHHWNGRDALMESNAERSAQNKIMVLNHKLCKYLIYNTFII